MKRSLLLALLVPVVVAGSVNAATDYLLEIDGIKGESKDTKRRGAIEIESFSWGMTNAPATSGGGSGKISVHDISVVTSLSKASPQLLAACAGGTNILSATLYVRDTGSTNREYYQIKLDNVQVSSLKLSSAPAAAGDRPTEEVAFYFSKLTATYTEEDGTVTTGVAVKPSPTAP